nr:Uncharacterised protein [Raoultella sp. NCTC 9187]
MVYSSQAFLTTPLTQDPQFYSLFLNAQTPSLLPQGEGSSLPQAVALALKNLPAGRDAPRSLILVADTLSPADAAWLKGQRLPLQIWVPGTAAGGALPERYASRGVDTRLNVERFSQVRDGGIPVTLVTGDNDDMQAILSHIQQSVTQQNNARQDLRWQNSGYLLVIPMLILLLFWRRPAHLRHPSAADPALVAARGSGLAGRVDTAGRPGAACLCTGRLRRSGGTFSRPAVAGYRLVSGRPLHPRRALISRGPANGGSPAMDRQ